MNNGIAVELFLNTLYLIVELVHLRVEIVVAQGLELLLCIGKVGRHLVKLCHIDNKRHDTRTRSRSLLGLRPSRLDIKVFNRSREFYVSLAFNKVATRAIVVLHLYTAQCVGNLLKLECCAKSRAQAFGNASFGNSTALASHLERALTIGCKLCAEIVNVLVALACNGLSLIVGLGSNNPIALCRHKAHGSHARLNVGSTCRPLFLTFYGLSLKGRCR